MQLDSDPIKQFNEWFEQAMQTDVQEPNAMNLATCNKDGVPSSRIVLLRGVDERGFVFYTNYQSRKGADIRESGHAALCFWWDQLERQVRVEGTVELASTEESDKYFASRPRGSQIGAIASHQSSTIDSYQQLLEQVAAVEKEYAHSEDIPRPSFWGGYRVVPQLIEFWRCRPCRLHERICYKKLASGDWEIEHLSP